jgi:predicted metalloprotease with PDZ domain
LPRTLGLGWALLLAVPSMARAQDPGAPPPPSVTTRLWINGHEVPPDQMQWIMPRRGRLGVSVNVRARETDSIGAYLLTVTPNGPAARAGLRSGDIIVRLDGKAVTGGPSTANAEQSVPGLKLIELAAKLPPADTIAVEYRRGAERRTTQLITSEEQGFAFRYGEDEPPGQGSTGELERNWAEMPLLRQPMGEMRFSAPFRMAGDLADLELAPINPDLGRYFGVTDGVLVIDVPEESRLNLKGGDVVLAVDGRQVTNPAHLLRILGSYESGEEIKLDIMRMKKRETVTGRIGYAEPRLGPAPPR